MFSGGVFINRENQAQYDVADFLQAAQNVYVEVPTLNGLETTGIPLPYVDDMTMWSRSDGVLTLRKNDLGNYYWDSSPDLRSHSARNLRVPYPREVITEVVPVEPQSDNVVEFSLYDYILENYRVNRMRLCDIISCVTRNTSNVAHTQRDMFTSWDANRFLRLCKDVKQYVPLDESPYAKTLFWQTAHNQMWDWCFTYREIFLVNHDEWLQLYPRFTWQGFSIAVKRTSVKTYDQPNYQSILSDEMKDYYGLQS